MQMHIHRSGNRRNLLRQLRRELIIPRIVPNHLQINRCRQAKVQDLVRHVRRRKEERRPRKLRAQISTQNPRIPLRILRSRLQRNLNIAIRVRDRRRPAEREVNSAVRQSNIIQDQLHSVRRNLRPDLLLDRRKILLRILQPQPRRRIHMQLHLPRVHIRKEVLANEERQRQAHDHQQRKQSQGDRRMFQAPVQQVFIVMLHLLKLPIELRVHPPHDAAPLLALTLPRVLIESDLFSQQKVHHRRHQCAR